MSATSVLPIIDLKKAQDPHQRSTVAKQLMESLEIIGFLFLDNVPGIDLKKLLKNTQSFFALSESEKLKVSKHQWNPKNQNRYRGYFPVQPGFASYKEGFEMGLDLKSDGVLNDHSNTIIPSLFTEKNIWPLKMHDTKTFQTDMEQFYKSMLSVGAEVLRLVALGSGLDELWFEDLFFPDSLSTLRVLHYPQRPGDPPAVARDGDSVLCCSDHSDSGFVTLLATFNYKGLQIRSKTGEWLDVPPRPDSLVMNIGDILSEMSDGRFKATKHRVVDTMVDRYSVPFFFEPRYTANISRTLPWSSSPSYMTSLPCRQYGPWLIEKMQTFAEYQDILK